MRLRAEELMTQMYSFQTKENDKHSIYVWSIASRDLMQHLFVNYCNKQ